MKSVTMEKRVRVQESFCDMFFKMPLSYLLKEAQQISAEHCEALGIGSSYMKSVGQAFLLAKLKVDIARQPRGGEEILVKTVPYLPRLFAYPRFTYFMDQAGETLVTIDSRWILVDTRERKIQRQLPSVMEGMFPEAGDIGDFRIPRMKEPAYLEDYPVKYSVTDFIGHMTNAAYGDVAVNCFGGELMKGKSIRRAMIAYHKEALPGDVIRLFTEADGDTRLVKGMLEDKPGFEAYLELTNQEE